MRHTLPSDMKLLRKLLLENYSSEHGGKERLFEGVTRETHKFCNNNYFRFCRKFLCHWVLSLSQRINFIGVSRKGPTFSNFLMK